MASGGQRGIDQDLVNVGKLRLKPNDLDPRGVVVVGDKLVITDWKSYKVLVYRRHDGMLLSSTDELESEPNGLCRVSDTEFCVAMSDGIIEIMSVQDSGLIFRSKTFHLQPTFDSCHGVALWNDNIVVSGDKDNTICWCVVSLPDGLPDKLHKVCEGNYISFSFLTVKQDMVYFSCVFLSDDDDVYGVYGFNLLNPSQPTYTYKHKELGDPQPRGITVNDIGHLFVCDHGNYDHSSIHHLTGKCELVAIYKNDLLRGPFAIFWESEVLYVTSWESNVITMYKTPQQNPLLPVEILSMDDNSIQLYKKALHDGMEKVYNIRMMVVGQFGVGKTTLIKRLLGQPVDISDRKSTEGIDVHKHCCKISLDKGEWIQHVEDSDQLYTLHRLNKLLSVPDQKPDINQEQDDIGEVINQREIVEVIYQREIVEVIYQRKITSEIDDTENKHLDKETDNIVAVPLSVARSSDSEKTKDAMMEILRLVNEKADKLVKDIEKYAALSIWDFAGQYSFYTTHQTFLTSRAIYLLVIDVSQQITDFIQDDKCFHDADGMKLHKVLDRIQIWMNSIHSSVASPEAIIPVILVGTHVDKLSEKSRKEDIDKYFIELRYMLGEKPTIRHLMDDIAIDNTQPDPMLEELKKRIFEISKQQPHWGEEKPARWLPLEQAIMTLKAAGVKVVPLSLIEEINMSASVKIEDRKELELFLKFHHEMGTILYFSVEELREKIVLEPKWMIDALKSLITAEIFIRKNPAITSKFREFIKTGKLTHELIGEADFIDMTRACYMTADPDVIWTKENNLEFHNNKDHILRLMEQLNIIAIPRIFSEEGKETKEECYFLAPCMLQEETPEEIISPKPNSQMESSPVLCYVFTGNFLPSAIFHRLVAACIAHWPVAKKKKELREENLIFCGCCVFQLDEQHKLTLHFREHVIFLRVTRMGIKDKTPSSKLCIEVREFITRNLLKIIGYLGQGLKFEYFIQCPEYNGVSINSLIPVSKLKEKEEVHCEFHDNMIESCKVLDFWFEDQEQSGDSGASSAGPMPSAPISDKDRFMCIAYLLNDVGSKVLRQLFHDMVTPTCTLDQYLANNRSKINKLLKKKVLNVSQMDIMFPPSGDPTNLTDYDITLLSALFNNIMPSLGHQEKNLIKSLRDNRNKLYGHTKSCKMNASDFQTCWSDISSTLKTLSQQCVDTKFKNDISMEIQQTQVPDASYLSMIHTFDSRIERIEQILESNKTSTSET